MPRIACSADNSACEGFFGRLKTELFYPRYWQDHTVDQFIQIVDSYIRWYNEKRIKIYLGSLIHWNAVKAWELRHKSVQFLRSPKKIAH